MNRIFAIATVVLLLCLGHPGHAENVAWTELHRAVQQQSVADVARLIQQGADPSAANLYGVTPLLLACQLGSHPLVEQLLAAGADPNRSIAGGQTPLMTAARTGDPRCVELLIQAGADVDATERRGQTALMWAAAEGNTAAVDALLHRDADWKTKTNQDFTAMLFAAREGHLQTCQRLVDAGADVNQTMAPSNTSGRNPRKGMTALMLAVESGHFELALWLVQNGANPNDQSSGYTPLHAVTWVRKTDRGDNVEGDPAPRGSGSVNSLQFVERIVAAGADVNATLKRGPSGRAKLNRKGATPFLLAAKTADLPLIETLLRLGASPTINNVDDCNPLMAAAGIGVVAVGEEAGTESEVLAVIDRMVQLGLDVNHVDKNGETAMHGAAYRNYPLVVAKLSSLGAKSSVWNQKNQYGWTPVMIASGKRPGSFKPSPETIAALNLAMDSEDPSKLTSAH
ncbi:Phosphocholine transferase AnkX [Rubripirellula lacrimiformis]|uniref:Phosphocholine transferase AnkX n=1 Tax=Rubripirellula lacrimiformis TaxID=1930273 RepID=A0A517NBW6_9BACT|nr:ankyrin repeat domain-containing protein [Rubripirellula lacrimiformis]QDT04637.1 Phosphocholine transferase AnkX [Rubripirellula lacrimiformis]